MKIALVLDPISENNPAGLGRAVLNFAKYIIQNRPNDTFIILTKHQVDISKLFGEETNILKHISTEGKAIYLSRQLQTEKCDLLVSFTPILPLLYRGKSIIFVHDFAYLQFETLVKKVSLFFLHLITLWKASYVCAVSNHTMNEARKIFFVPRKKIQVIYNGYEHLRIKKQNHIYPKKKQFLVVGVIKERKNTLNIIKAFQIFTKNYDNSYKLVVVGKNSTSYGKRVKNFVHDHNLERSIEFKGFVSDQELDVLYNESLALVYPSLVEGFGFPVLEAMERSLLVITSNRGALAEVAGAAAILVEPENPNDIARGLIKSLDESVRNVLVAKGIKNLERFSWEKSSSELSTLIEKVVSL